MDICIGRKGNRFETLIYRKLLEEFTLILIVMFQVNTKNALSVPYFESTICICNWAITHEEIHKIKNILLKNK